MSNKVVSLYPCANVAEGLRNIANQVEEGELPDDGCTVICGSDVFHLGCVDDAQAAGDAVFNMTYGLHLLMRPVVDAALDGTESE